MYALIRRLLRDYGVSRWRTYAVAFVFMAVSAGCTALSAYLIGDVINQSYVHHNFPAIVALSALIIVLFTTKGFCTYAHAVILARISNSIVAENQRRLFAKLMQENLDFFTRRHSSEFLARLQTGASAASQVLNLITTAAGRDLLTLIGLVAVMVAQDPVMSFVGLIVAPPALFTLRKLIRRAQKVAERQYTSGARIFEAFSEAIQGIRVVKAFTLEPQMMRRVDANVLEIESNANKMAKVANRASPLMESLGGIAIALAVLYGGYRVIMTGAPPGAFFSFMTAFLLAYEPAKRLARLNIDLSNNLVFVRLLFEIIDSPATEPEEPAKPALAVRSGRIAFDRVDFAYRPDEPVLRGISFIAEPGKTTALVGPSGGGKSTILSLILRLQEPQGGTIAIDGQDLSAVSRASVRRQIAYVAQDAFLFRGTVRENIAFGRPDASEDEIVAAAKAANAHGFIAAFPRGYDAEVGEHGFQLSGGQRQRLAIARALLKDAPIILLDEATAALDNESERLVQEAMARLSENRTTVVIAHRLNTIMHAEMIHVVEAGIVVESGTHGDLLQRGGRYASFYRVQLRAQESMTEHTIAASG